MAATLTQDFWCESTTAGVTVIDTSTPQCFALSGTSWFSRGFSIVSVSPGSISVALNGGVQVSHEFISLAHFTGSLSFTDTVIADGGPERAGVLSYTASVSSGQPYLGTVEGSMTFGDYGIAGGANQGASSTATIPVTIGIPFAISIDETLFAYAEHNDGGSGGGVTVALSYHFFEADGVTPVVMKEYVAPAAVANPEPGTLALLLVAGIALIRRKL